MALLSKGCFAEREARRDLPHEVAPGAIGFGKRLHNLINRRPIVQLQLPAKSVRKRPLDDVSNDLLAACRQQKLLQPGKILELFTVWKLSLIHI